MSFDAVDSLSIANVQQSFHGYEDSMANEARHDEDRIGPDATLEAQDYKYVNHDPSMSDYVEAGSVKRPEDNIVAQYFDTTGSIVNRYI